MSGDAPTEAAPTGVAENVTAWSEDEGEDWPLRGPRWVTRTAVAGSLAAVAVAIVLAVQFQPEPTPTATTTVVTAPRIETYKAEPTFDANVPAAKTIHPPPPPEPVIPASAAFDRLYLQRLKDQGWTITDPALLAHRGHQICAMLQDGVILADVQDEIITKLGLDRVGAWQMAYTAQQTYPDCP